MTEEPVPQVEAGWGVFRPVRGKASEYLGVRPVLTYERCMSYPLMPTRREAILAYVRSCDQDFEKMPDELCLLQWRRWKANDYGPGASRIQKVDSRAALPIQT